MTNKGTPDKCLLERGVPVALINDDSKKEKLGNAKPPISKIHYYHTRKPLIISRLAVAGTLLGADEAPADADRFYQFFGLDQTLKTRGFRRVPAELLSKIRERYPEGVTVLDPFAGTGMILFEALRLGCSVVGVDYNPVACLIMRATLEYPLKYSQIDPDGEFKLYKDVKKYAEEIFNKLKGELQQFYPPHNGKDVKAYIHAWAVKCPHCGKETPLVQNWWLDSKEKAYLGYKVIDGQIKYSIRKGEAPEGNISQGKAMCLFCTHKIDNDHIVEDIKNNEREHLLALYLGKGEFAVADDAQKEALRRAEEYLMKNLGELSAFIPTELMADDNRSLWLKKYLQNWHRLFNPRQLLVLASLAKEIRKKVEELKEKDRDREYAAAVGTYLSLLLAKHVDYNSRSAMWHSLNIQIAHTFTMRSPGMMWNHAEPNPFVKFSGSLGGGIQDVLDGLKFALSELNRPGTNLEGFDVSNKKPTAEVINASTISWNPKRKFKFIITDPPYYDDVQYPEIMQFFQVWHARTVGDLLGFTSVPDTSEDLSVGRDRDEKMFEDRMMLAIRKIYDLLEDGGTATIFYAHKKIEGWKYLLEALRQCGFRVTSTVALWTESSENVMARGKSSIYHSLLLTARKRTEDRRANIIEVEEEIRKKMLERYPELEALYGKDRVNLMVAASGIVIEVMTSYSEIVSFTKDLPSYALEAGQRFLMEAFARRVLGLERVDPQTMVYVWLRHEEEEWLDYTEFNQTLKAAGLLEHSLLGLVEKQGGKVRLLPFAERASLEVEGMEPLIASTLIDAAHIALREYAREGATAAAEYAKSSPFGFSSIARVIKALAEIASARSGYAEGEECKKLLRDWQSGSAGLAKFL